MTGKYKKDEIRCEMKGGVEQITRPYREGFAAQKLGKLWGFIDESGHLAIKRKFDYCHDFCNGLAAVRIGEKWAFIDMKGSPICNPLFDDAKSFQGGFAEVRLGNEWRFLSKGGTLGNAVPAVVQAVESATQRNLGVSLQTEIPVLKQGIAPARTPEYQKGDASGWYWIGYRISFAFVFAGCWIWCIASYGFLFGVGLGWLPSAIAAVVLSFFWPLTVVLPGIGILIVIWTLAK